MKEVILIITPDDIAKGEPGECSKCPIALSAVRLGHTCVVISDDHADLSGTRYKLGEKAEKFIKDFDNKKQVDPTTIVLLEDMSDYEPDLDKPYDPDWDGELRSGK